MKIDISMSDDPRELGERILDMRNEYPALAFYRLSELVDGEAKLEVSPEVVPFIESVNKMTWPNGMECQCLYHEQGTHHSNPQCPFFID